MFSHLSKRGISRNTLRFLAAGVPDLANVDPYSANVVMMLDFAGSNGSASIIDICSNPKAITAMGNAQISTARAKFGTASGLFDGSGDFLTIPVGTTDFAFGSGDFCLDGWVYPTVSSGNQMMFCGQGNNTNASGCTSALYVMGTAKSDIYIGGGGCSVNSPNPAINTWSHVAWERFGSNWTTYLNGAVVDTIATAGTGAVNVGATTYPNCIGASPTGGAAFSGNMDGVRLTRYARFRGAFTPPTLAWPAQ